MRKRILAIAMAVCFVLAACTQSQGTSTESTQNAPIEKKSLDSYSWNELSRISNEIAQAPSDEAGREVALRYGLVNEDGSLTDQRKVVFLEGLNDVDVRLAGIRHDDKADGSGKAGLTFMTVGKVDTRPMNNEATIEGGWEASALRAWLAGEMKAMLDADLQAALLPVNKLTNNVGITDDPESVTPTSDQLWVFSVHEVCGDVFWDGDEFLYQRGDEDVDGLVNTEGNQYEVFASAGVTGTSDPTGILSLAKVTGKEPWWYRTPYPFDWQGIENTGSNGFFYQVRDSGYPESEGIPNVPAAVVVGFCV